MLLTFFVELDDRPLGELFRRPTVMQCLADAGAALSMAMLDLSSERAEAIRALNEHGIPVTAWLVLEEDQGYWLNADNVALAGQRYLELHRWAQDKQLKLAAVGLDIEPPHRDSVALARLGHRALKQMLRRRRSREQLQHAKQQVAQLINQIRDDGYAVETYQIPLLLDERLAGSSLLQRASGIMDVTPDREVIMLYRSMLPAPLGEGLVDAYGPHCDAIAVGITGGGVGFVRDLPHVHLLNLEMLLADLRRARRYTDHLYVFSLEGCVQAGYLKELCRADLSQSVDPAPLSNAGRLARMALQTLLRGEKLMDLFHGEAGDKSGKSE
jgi:hypothetical protein